MLVIYTPAIPGDSVIMGYFRKNGYNIHKRAEILGLISTGTDTIAVAGTHGKTTISTMIAHLLKQSHVDCSAFLGGISRNYNTNMLLGEGRYTVMEADEYDRSFHTLSPLMAVISSVDADHLDIYGDHKSMIEAYNVFCEKIRPGGLLIVNSRIKNILRCPSGLTASLTAMIRMRITGILISSIPVIFTGSTLKRRKDTERSPGLPFPGKSTLTI